MTTGVLLGWEPATPNTYARPVQDESATAGLCGAELPDGRGLLVWPNGGAARFAVTPSTAEFLIDDSVPSSDFATITTGSVRTTSCYVIGGQAYATVVTFSGSVTTTQIWKADDVTDPYAGWSVVATLQNDFTPGARFGMETWGAGIPLELASGRLVFSQGCWMFGIPSHWGDSGANSAVWTSDGGMGGPWTLRNQFRHPSTNFSRIDFCSPQVGRDPATGHLYYHTASGAGGTPGAIMWRSTNDGTSWTQNNQSPGGFNWGHTHRIQGFVNNGTTLFSFGGSTGGETGGQSADVLALTGAFDDMRNDINGPGGWTNTGQDWRPYTGGQPYTRKGIVATNAVFFFEQDRVMWTQGPPPAGWIIGTVQSGTPVTAGWQ